MATDLLTKPSPVPSRTINRDHLSFSAVRLYQTCPLRFYFKYRLGLLEETVSSSLVFGASVHAAIEHHFRALLSGDPAPDLDTLLAEFWEGWKDHEAQEIRFGKDDDLSSMGRLAERTLIAFQQSEVAQPSGQILAVEEELRGPVVPGCPDVLGRVDLITDTGSELVISDWKTARTRWTHDQAEDASEQLLLYSELTKDFAPGKPARLEFVILTKTKDVVVDRHALSVDPARIARVKRVMEQVWRAIEAECFYPAPSAMNCLSCPYRQACRDWQA